MPGRLLPIVVVLAASTLGLSFGLQGLWSWAAIVVEVGCLWLLGWWRGWDWIASIGLAFLVSVAAVGLWLMNVEAGWALLGVVAALSAWDLDHFARRLERAGQVEDARHLERRHLKRLLIVDGLGLLLGAVALRVRVEFGFGVALLLGLMAVLGVSQVLGFLRREGE